MTGPTVGEPHLRARLAHLPAEHRAELAARLRRRRASLPSSADWIVRRGPADPLLRLFCFSYAGGSAAIFRTWDSHLPPWVEVCAIQLPGRESRAAEPAYRRIDALLTDLHPEIVSLLDRPYAFFGHSMGALVAFELARRLRLSDASQPEHLFLAAFRAPQLPNPNIRIHHLPDEVIKTVLAKEGTPQRVLDNDELMGALLPTLRADFELCDTYEYTDQAPLAVPMSIYGGLHDIRVGRGDLEPWKEHAGNRFRLAMLPGSHFFIHDAGDLLLAQLAATLESAASAKGDIPA